MRRFVLSLIAAFVVVGVASAAILGKVELKSFKFKEAGEWVGYSESEDRLYFLAPNTAEAPVSIPADGEYTITIDAACDAALGENAKMTITVGDVVVKKDFLLTDTDKKTYTFTAKLKKGDPKLGVEFTNDAYKEGEYDRNLFVHAVKVEAKK